MKAEELMIGDWVIEKDRVCRVSFNTTIEEVRKEDCATSASSGTRYYDIEPIQLTPEILEKNYGKEMRVGISDKPCWGEMGATWMTMLWKCENSFWLEVSTIADGFVKKHILYVHELQHALRLAGIKKEIVL